MSMFLERNGRGLARMLYWVSMLLLIIGGGVLIDPTHRQTGITVHIYITLVAFELYIWLLMLLARWQAGRKMDTDVARSGIFAMVIQGLMFVALIEMHGADANQGVAATVVVAVLAAAKIPLAARWLGIALPAPLLVVNNLWILLMAVPALLLRQYRGDSPAQHVIGYLSCWAVAILLAAHIPLAIRQGRKGMHAGDPAIGRWYVPWLISGVLGAMTILQLHAARWGTWVDWPLWYFSPIWLAAGCAALVLAAVSGRGMPLARPAMAFAVGFVFLACGDNSPAGIPASWQRGLMASLVHPLYSPGALLAAMLAVAGIMLHRRWLVVLAVTLPALAILYAVSVALETQLVRIGEWRYFPGVVLVACAFILLGVGALLQRYHERHPAAPRAARPSPPEPEPLPDSLAQPAPASLPPDPSAADPPAPPA